MRYEISVLVSVAIWSSGCVAAEECCTTWGMPKHYGQALEYHLAKNGIPFQAVEDAICVASNRGADLETAERQVNKYFYEVARPLTDQCEERAFAEWAKKEFLRYDIGSAADSQGRPAGNMFFLRSFTYDEVVSNRRRLEVDAPRNAQCARGTS